MFSRDARTAAVSYKVDGIVLFGGWRGIGAASKHINRRRIQQETGHGYGRSIYRLHRRYLCLLYIRTGGRLFWIGPQVIQSCRSLDTEHPALIILTPASTLHHPLHLPKSRWTHVFKLWILGLGHRLDTSDWRLGDCPGDQICRQHPQRFCYFTIDHFIHSGGSILIRDSTSSRIGTRLIGRLAGYLCLQFFLW